MRGLGGKVKLRSMRELMIKEKVQFIYLQETKFEEVSTSLCYLLVGNYEVEWRAGLASNATGGILCLWKKDMCG